jgi:hypothetical protein
MRVTRKGDLIEIGGGAFRVDRVNTFGLAGEGDAEPTDAWRVYRRVDVSDDPETTYEYRYEPVGADHGSEDAAVAAAKRLHGEG